MAANPAKIRVIKRRLQLGVISGDQNGDQALLLKKTTLCIQATDARGGPKLVKLDRVGNKWNKSWIFSDPFQYILVRRELGQNWVR